MAAAVWAVLVLVAAWGSTPLAAEEALSRHSQRQLHMGVEFEIVVYARDSQTAETAFAAGYERIAQLDRTMNDYQADSELSRLSESSPTEEPIVVSDDLWIVLNHAQGLSRRSDGAFDVTAGPLTKLWRRARRQNEPPTTEQIARALQSVGYPHMELLPQRRAVSLRKPGMRLDLGGIAKGYAADQALAAIGKLGIRQALVRASGDIAMSEPPPGKTGWRVGIAPLDAEKEPTRFVSLANCAISTSGDSRQHLIADGKRYSHIVDPRTGWGVEGRSSVTVIAPRGIEADGLASAVSVLGPAKGLELVEESKGAAALIVTEEEGKEVEHRSARFAALEVRP